MFGAGSLHLPRSEFRVPDSVPLPGGGQEWVIPAPTIQHSNAPTLPRSPIQWTPHPQARLLHDMCINLRRAHILVSKQLLNRANVVTGFQKARRPRKSFAHAVSRNGCFSR
jgi:hypothetical protein